MQNPFNVNQYPVSHYIWKGLTSNDIAWFQSTKPDINRFSKALIHVLNHETMNALFPKHGTIRRSGSYFYLDIQDNGRYVDNVSRLLNAIHSKTQYSDRQGCRAAKYSIFPPPSPSGSHVTLDTPNKGMLQKRIGQKIRFVLLDLVSYKHDSRGYSPSGFDSALFPCQWYVLRVKLDHSMDALNIFDPHISVGILASKNIGIQCTCNQKIQFGCGGCLKQFYCSLECAQNDWDERHSKICSK